MSRFSYASKKLINFCPPPRQLQPTACNRHCISISVRESESKSSSENIAISSSLLGSYLKHNRNIWCPHAPHTTLHSVIETIKFSLTFVSRVSFRIWQTPLCLVAVSETINVRWNENDIKRGRYSLGTADPAARVCVIIVRQWETNFRFSSALLRRSNGCSPPKQSSMTV